LSSQTSDAHAPDLSDRPRGNLQKLTGLV